MAERELIGMTLHFKDGSTEKVPVSALINWKQSKGGSGGGQTRYNWVDDDECPKHGRWEVIPAGYSKKTEKDYDAFFSCKSGCDNRPGRGWTDDGPSPETYSEQTESMTDSSDDMDSLPF
jgi:hypothetical protein